MTARLRVVEWGPGRVRIRYEADRDEIVAALAAAHPRPDGSADAGEARPPTGDIVRDLVKGGLVGLPLDGQAQLSVLEAREVVRLPASQVGGVAAELRLEGPAYLGETGYVRHQRVVQVGFGPSLEGERWVALYDRIEIEIRFADPGASGGTRSRGSPDRFGEALYAATVLNHQQAQRWRQRRTWPAARPAQEGSSLEEMVKVVVRHPGFHRISGQDLVEAGVQLGEVHATRIRMLYGGGRILGRSRRVSDGIQPEEIPIVVEDGDDGNFDLSDYLLFYGEPTERWEYDPGSQSHFFRHNPYTADNVYWLHLGANRDGLRATSRSGYPTHAGPLRVDQYRERAHQERERFTLLQLVGINSGYDWYWESFHGNARNYSALIRDAVDDSVGIRVRLSGDTEALHWLRFRWNDTDIGSRTFRGSGFAELEMTAPTGTVEGLNQLGLIHRGSEPAQLDWIQLEYSRRLVARDGELSFDWGDAARAMDGGPYHGTAEFRISGLDGERPRIFDVSNGLSEIAEPVRDRANQTLVFQDRYDGAGEPPAYRVAASSGWRRPARITRDTPSRLRSSANGAEYVIITHGDFRRPSERLAAWRAQDDRFGQPLTTAVVDVEDVYDEFSGGLLDPMAIRSFINFAVDHWDPSPFFILLVGDGTYDYKNNSGTSHTNWMPAYQDGISMYDEWYVRIEGEDEWPDLAIGRLPVQTAAQADAVVDKLISYDREPEAGPWRARTLLIADDLRNPGSPSDLETYFINNAEALAQRLLPENLDLVKLYLASFPQEGRTKPRARDEFLHRFNEGALLVTYLGHGNPETLAHEQVFVLSRDFGAIANGRRWPLIFTAASQVGVFDDPLRQSMPEVFLNAPDRGAIGFISASRLGFHTSNVILLRQFYELMFRTGEPNLPVGLALTAAKQLVELFPADPKGRVNVQRYCLLGDPATRLAIPRLRVQLDLPDTLRALEEVHIVGRILTRDNHPITDYDGSAWVRVFDSAARAELDGISYLQLGAPVFRSLAHVENGRFEATFRVPKDITYRSRLGRASAYAWKEGTGGSYGDESAFGAVDGLVMAGTSAAIELDETGPQITLGFRGQSGFRSGDHVAPHPVMEAVLADASGINITGETGHKIAMTVDGQRFDVTGSFSNRDGDYTSGVLEYQLPALEPGVHTISLKAWDTFNNSSLVEAEARVAEPGTDLLSHVLFHPNPMRQEMGFFTYHLAAPAQEVHIGVYTLAGRLVEQMGGDCGVGHNRVEWVPRGHLANSAYPYCITAVFGSGREATARAVLQVLK